MECRICDDNGGFCVINKVNVAALLPSSQLLQLRAALGREHGLCPAADWDHMASLLRETVCDVAVVGPGTGGTVEVGEVRSLIANFPSTPVVVYVPVAPAAMRAVTELARHGVGDVVLYNFDDGAERFRRVLERQAGDPLAREMLARLAPALVRLDASLAAAVERAFREPHLFPTAEDLAAAAGKSRRTMYRQFEQAGLAAPRLLVIGARVLRGYSFLRDPGQSLQTTARKLRFKSARTFSEHMQEMVGELAASARRRLTPEEFLRRLHRRLIEPQSTRQPASNGA